MNIIGILYKLWIHLKKWPYEKKECTSRLLWFDVIQIEIQSWKFKS